MSTGVQGAAVASQSASGLEHFPVPLFSSVMGLAGLAIAWQKAHSILGAPASVGAMVRLVATIAFLALALMYAAKWIRHPAAAAAEARHPVRINFLSAIPIGMLLLATAWLDDLPHAATGLWAVGAVLQLVLTLRVIGSWIHHTHYDIKHVNPAWFIPVVGNIIVPIAGAKIGSTELSWFFFSIGIVFWGVLLTILMYRLFFHEALPPRMMPTMFILLAPPSVGFLAWMALTGDVGVFGRMLFYTALFLALVLATSALHFLRLPFFLSSWAYSFPIAALTIATMTMYHHTGVQLLSAMAFALLALLTIVIALLCIRTVIAARRGQICVPE
ncbi:MAG TPA: SLAC1 anion channel family protein [Noviherbaspirillum sp.]|nr:SLAC1 anion channel family protein [Noviherbaspirillum sp.]